MSLPISRELNEAALDHFVYMPVTSPMIQFLALKASEVIACDPKVIRSSRDGATTIVDAYGRTKKIPSLERFISTLIRRSNVQVPTLMCSLIYLDRLRAKLPQEATGLPCTVHRIFLSALILSAKFLNDSSPKNKHWASYTTVPNYENFNFSRSEVNLMEIQLLSLLDFNLIITEEDLFEHFEPFLAPIRFQMQKNEEAARRDALMKAHRDLEIVKQTEAGWLPPYDDSVYYSSRPISSSIHPVYDSPPPATEVPGLSHSGNVTSGETVNSSASSVISRSGTPASSIGSGRDSAYLDGEECTEIDMSYYDTYSSNSPRVLRDTVHVHIPSTEAYPHPLASKRDLLPYEIERDFEVQHEKLPKKRTGIFSRLRQYV